MMFAKDEGFGEQGLGFISSIDADHEINTSHYIELDLTNILNITDVTPAAAITIQSVQPGEGFNLYTSSAAGGNIANKTLVPGSPFVNPPNGLVVTVPIPAGIDLAHPFLAVQASSGNVLLTTLQFNSCGSAVTVAGCDMKQSMLVAGVIPTAVAGTYDKMGQWSAVVTSNNAVLTFDPVTFAGKTLQSFVSTVIWDSDNANSSGSINSNLNVNLPAPPAPGSFTSLTLQLGFGSSSHAKGLSFLAVLC